jgi:membrane fusion protein (multidrug efflux system)
MLSGERVRFQPVRVGRNLGNTVEVSAGLVGQERLVLNPGPELTEGTRLRAVPSEAFLF